MKAIRWLPLFFLSMYACVDPLSVNLIDQKPNLVVDGLITDQPGPYEVKLYYASGLDSTLKRPKVESASSVWILSDANESELLTEIIPGTYQTKAGGIRGLLGRNYKLKIVTKSGKTYETNYQKLYPSGVIDSVFVSFKSEAISDDSGTELKDALTLLINARGNSEDINLLRWKWKSVYKAKSFPELRKDNRQGVLYADPEPCSGYVANGKLISKVGECTCCICWATEYNSAAMVSENSYVNDNEFNNLKIGQLLITSMKFYDRIYVEVEQQSLSQEVYDFWKLVETQQKAAGNLFQPNAVKIRGNVFCVSDNSEEVLGVFVVAAVTKKAIFIDRSSIPYQLPSIDTIGYDCRKSFINGTTQKPPFW